MQGSAYRLVETSYNHASDFLFTRSKAEHMELIDIMVRYQERKVAQAIDGLLIRTIF